MGQETGLMCIAADHGLPERKLSCPRDVNDLSQGDTRKKSLRPICGETDSDSNLRLNLLVSKSGFHADEKCS
jgi:hypothetical protein